MTSSLGVTALAIQDAFGMTKPCRNAANQP
jgi:hypothetical protein